MKKIIILLISIFIFNQNFAQQINWKTIEEADKIQKQNPKKLMFIDLYTSWCGFCKVLDKETFTDKNVIEYINKNFIPVKFNAESKEIIKFKGNRFEYIPYGRSGYNELAYYILDGRLSYPSMVVLNSKMERENVILGYVNAEELLKKLKN